MADRIRIVLDRLRPCGSTKSASANPPSRILVAEYYGSTVNQFLCWRALTVSSRCQMSAQ
jgi:hypothetical protein